MKKNKNAKFIDSYYKVIPLALILLVVPMIVFMKSVTVEGVATQFYNLSSVDDFFTYYKVVWLLVFSVSSILFVTYYTLVKKLKITVSTYFIPLFVYYLFVFLSSTFSKYHDIAFNGSIDRFEGFWAISCYIIICFIAAHFITFEKDIKLLFIALGICTTLLCILGLTQFFGFDLLQTDFMKHVILPKDFHHLSDSLDFAFPEKYIYLTLFNPNYVGSFCALVLPICIAMLLLSKTVHVRIISGVLSALVLANLICSRSSTGYFSVLVSIIILAVLLRKKIKEYWLPVLGLIICSVGVLIFINYNYSGFIVDELRNFLPEKQSQEDSNSGKYITDMEFDKNKMTLHMGDIYTNIVFKAENRSLNFLDENGNNVKFRKRNTDQNLLLFDQSKYRHLRIQVNGSLLKVSASNTFYYVTLDETGSFKFINSANKPVDIVKAPSFGFEGYEKWASNRGYIWSRSIPILKDTILLGHGPDTFAYYFPQNDFKGKLISFENPNIFVDKPHNMYLQIATNTGVISLIAFLVFVFWYIGSSFKLYFVPKKEDSFYYIAGSACVVSVIGFLVAGLANDSNVTVSPIFWILLGVGFASNRLYKKEIGSTKLKESLSKPTIASKK